MIDNGLAISFEFFPPQTPEMEATLWAAIVKLAPLDPSFVSVTYGAGGSTRARTHATIRRMLDETDLKPAAHLTCVGASRAEIDAIARQYWEMGVRHIVALRGDAPPDSGPYAPHADGYAYASDLVAALRRIGEFEVSVAAYPETHPDAASAEADLDNLKRKIDAGASRAITQFFFDVPRFERFRERAAQAGVNVPIVPGIMPVTNVANALRFSKRCGTVVPDWLAELFDGLDRDPETRRLVACSVACEQVRALRDLGISEFHFYTLNRADLVVAICRRLGVKPPVGAASADAAAVHA